MCMYICMCAQCVSMHVYSHNESQKVSFIPVKAVNLLNSSSQPHLGPRKMRKLRLCSSCFNLSEYVITYIQYIILVCESIVYSAW